MHIDTFILTSFMTLMHRRYCILPMERVPQGPQAAHGPTVCLLLRFVQRLGVLLVFGGPTMLFNFFQFIWLCSLEKQKPSSFYKMIINTAKLCIFSYFLASVWGKAWLNSWGILKCICAMQTRSSPNLPNIIGYQKWKSLSHVWLSVTPWTG